MSDIVFISRSVADELCNFEESYNIMFVGMSDFTRKMLSLVRKNRNKPRKRQKQEVTHRITVHSMLLSTQSKEKPQGSWLTKEGLIENGV